MEESSSDADSHSETQEIPHTTWNLKIDYRVHKNCLLDPVVSQFNPVHVLAISVRST
jgi:hypothetical protein